MWQPTATFETIQHRAKILKTMRNFFDSRGVTEVETPALSHAIGTDAYLDGFSSSYDFDSSGKEKRLFLQTSPEYAMKRLLSAGYGCIYQIAKAYRHEPSGKHHNCEFTMLEWYRLGFTHLDLIDEVEQLLTTVLETKSAVKISYQQVFVDNVKVDPLTATREQLLSLLKECGKLSDWHLAEQNIDMLLQFVFCELVEPYIGLTEPWFVYDFPASQASLARLNENDPRVAHRFECYFQGLELANGFYELKSASEQLQRFNKDNEQRKLLNKDIITIDDRFISALEHGLPDCAGVALGVDRLMMLALNKQSIKEVLTFPIESA